ncbi:MAG: hypothetical protein N4A49_01865 [Marinifilaceae bacterium]|jgi:hypothetical protein|nr:hypothetical protein [Marinifilaceae bacterium]
MSKLKIDLETPMNLINKEVARILPELEKDNTFKAMGVRFDLIEIQKRLAHIVEYVIFHNENNN